MYEMATRLYDDGTPKTKHLTTNVRIDVDDAAGTASSTANYLVTQATPDLPLQVIVTGHYRDTFHLVDGLVVVRHQDHVRRPGRRHQPPSEVLTAVAAVVRRRSARGDRAAEGGSGRLGPAAVPGAARRPGRRLRRAPTSTTSASHILRSGLVHSLRMRLRAAGVDPAAPRDHRRRRSSRPIVVIGMMRSGTTLLQRLLAADDRFHCAYGWEVVEVAPKLDHR